MVTDDHPVFQEGLCRLLSDEPDFEIVAKSGNGEETIRQAKDQMPDIAIIDVALPGMNGFEVAEKIKEYCPKTKILILSAYSYEPYLLAAMRAGVDGYVLKHTPVEKLMDAIRLVHSGQAVFDLAATIKILKNLARVENTNLINPRNLHRREIMILKLATDGLGNKEIAAKLFISERTVQTHFVNIFRKLGAKSRTDAVLRALREGYLTLENLHGAEEQCEEGNVAGRARTNTA